MSGNTENANRQKARAREAHETVRRFLPKATPNPEQKKKIEAGLAELDAKQTLWECQPHNVRGLEVSEQEYSTLNHLGAQKKHRSRQGRSQNHDMALRQELCEAAKSGHQIAVQLMAQSPPITKAAIQENLTLLENLLRKLESDKRPG